MQTENLPTFLSSSNPFKVTSPEDLDVDMMKTLFVEDLDEIALMKDEGHMMLKGPRGVGKSMIFRYLQADCQCRINGEIRFSDLKFFGIYLPIRNESFVKITELRRLGDDYAADLFMEHLMVITFAMRGFSAIEHTPGALDSIDSKSFFRYYQGTILPFFNSSDFDDQCVLKDSKTILTSINSRLKNEYNKAKQFINRLRFNESAKYVYDGSFFDYQDFLMPLFSDLRDVEGFPHAPIYLLIDDAHYMTEAQTRILNSWIATRGSSKVSIKISTQYDYKTIYTVTGETIDTPHDYKLIDLWELYTTRDSYRERIRSIVLKRLKHYGFADVEPEAFFPADIEQEEEIERIATEYKEKSRRGEGSGYYVTDDAYRYARADYIKKLYGKSKSAYSYSYAGFSQLVNISSGVVRYFLDAAHDMFASQQEKNSRHKTEVKFIEPGIQSDVVRKLANKFLKDELDEYKIEGYIKAHPKEDFDLLTNLINGLGALFNAILLSERKERRVFTVAISDEMSDLTSRIFKIGVRYGYFHRSTIGRKERGAGRTWRFVMNRRLAPVWTLDPNSFAGYLFVQNKLLEDTMYEPKSILRRLKNSSGENTESDYVQLSLFDMFDYEIENQISVSVENFRESEV